MIRTVLAAVHGTDADGPVLSTSAMVARTFESNIRAAFLRFDPAAVARSAGVARPRGIIADLVKRLEHAAGESAARAKATIQKFCTRERLPFTTGPAAPPSVQWRTVEDEPHKLATAGMTADLIVASRPSPDDPNSNSTFNTFLFQTGRPVLVPRSAPNVDLLARVAIAWKPTAQAARALAFGIPFLSRAKVVSILTAQEDGKDPDLEGVISYLRAHGVKAEGRHLSPVEGSAAAAVLTAARNESLLIMGAYGHSRIGEWAFGGFTRTIVEHAPIPVLMAH